MNQAQFSDLQRWIASALRRRTDLSRDPEVERRAARYFTGNDRLSPVEQLEIYREQFWFRHTSSLLEDFPGLCGIIGQSAWERLVEEYLEARAPSSRSLRDLGQGLPAFVEACTWLAHPALCLDMARLEWLYIELFDAADCAGLNPEKLASVPEQAWQTARIVLNPALRLLRVSYPVADLRRKLKNDTDSVSIPEACEQWLVLYRSSERKLCDQPVTPAAFALLDRLKQGTALVPACESVIEAMPEQAETIENEIGAWFKTWGERAWIVDVITDDSDHKMSNG